MPLKDKKKHKKIKNIDIQNMNMHATNDKQTNEIKEIKHADQHQQHQKKYTQSPNVNIFIQTHSKAHMNKTHPTLPANTHVHKPSVQGKNRRYAAKYRVVLNRRDK